MQAFGPNHPDTVESRKNLAMTLVAAGRFDDAMPHLRELLAADVPSEARIDLADPQFNRMRRIEAFRALEAEAGRASSPR